jgi:hypothetical protein
VFEKMMEAVREKIRQDSQVFGQES